MKEEKTYFEIWKKRQKEDDHLSFYQTRYWYEIWSKYYQGGIEFLRLNNQLLCPVLAIPRNRFIKEYHAAPRGTYAILLGEIPENKIETPSNSYIRLDQKNILFSKYSKVEYTRILDLTKPLSLSKKHQKILDNPQISLRKTEDLEEWKEYHEIYMAAHKGRKTNSVSYKWDLFRLFFESPEKHRRLWVALKDNKIIAGALCFYWKNKVNYWHAASSLEYRHQSAGHHLVKKMIDDAKERNYEILDMGNSTGLDGVDKFKARFGADKVPNYLYYNESLALRAINKWNRLTR